MDKVTARGVVFCSLMLLGAVLPIGVANADTLPLGTSCGETAARVHVDGFKDRVGNLRVQAYGSDTSEFLDSGKKIVRIEGKVSPDGKMSVCVPLPGPGTYALVGMHERNAPR